MPISKPPCLVEVKGLSTPSDDTALAAENNLPRIVASIECLAQRDVIATSFAQALQLSPVLGGHCTQAAGMAVGAVALLTDSMAVWAGLAE